MLKKCIYFYILQAKRKKLGFWKICHAFFFSYFLLCFWKKYVKSGQKIPLFFANHRAKVEKEQISSRVLFSILAAGNEKNVSKKVDFFLLFFVFFSFSAYKWGVHELLGHPLYHDFIVPITCGFQLQKAFSVSSKMKEKHLYQPFMIINV